MTDCIEHTQRGDRAGYGSYRYMGAVHRAHRVVYAKYHNVSIDTLPVIMHSCDNPRCINIAHLSSGTHADNMADRDAKGRVAHGDTHYLSKLTAEQVVEARSLYIPRHKEYGMRALAKHYHVSASTLSVALSGKQWVRA